MLLSARKLCRSFGENQVLFDIDLALQGGQVHALLGKSGAGKSTLVKILGGYLHPISGAVCVDDQPRRYCSSGEMEADGIAMIHQVLALAEPLSIAENIVLGRELRWRSLKPTLTPALK
nr:ATP-binding cassette domain-containing protein [Halomonas sp.]